MAVKHYYRRWVLAKGRKHLYGHFFKSCTNGTLTHVHGDIHTCLHINIHIHMTIYLYIHTHNLHPFRDPFTIITCIIQRIPYSVPPITRPRRRHAHTSITTPASHGRCSPCPERLLCFVSLRPQWLLRSVTRRG